METSKIVLCVIGGIIVIGGLLFGCPQYKVYKQRKDGEAALAHAQSSKEVQVAEARAKMESAAYLAQADTLRAIGTARSNVIIGTSLTEAYLQWFWIEQLKENQSGAQYIYVPSGQMGMPVMEAGRFGMPK